MTPKINRRQPAQGRRSSRRLLRSSASPIDSGSSRASSTRPTLIVAPRCAAGRWSYELLGEDAGPMADEDPVVQLPCFDEAVRRSIPDDPRAFDDVEESLGGWIARFMKARAAARYEEGRCVSRPRRRRERDRHVVDPRLRTGRRRQPGREPLRRLRPEPGPRRPEVLRPLPPPPRHGDPSRDRLDRLGLGRLVGREHEGLHALLVQRALTPRAGPDDAVAGRILERLVRPGRRRRAGVSGSRPAASPPPRGCAAAPATSRPSRAGRDARPVTAGPGAASATRAAAASR